MPPSPHHIRQVLENYNPWNITFFRTLNAKQSWSLWFYHFDWNWSMFSHSPCVCQKYMIFRQNKQNTGSNWWWKYHGINKLRKTITNLYVFNAFVGCCICICLKFFINFSIIVEKMRLMGFYWNQFELRNHERQNHTLAKESRCEKNISFKWLAPKLSFLCGNLHNRFHLYTIINISLIIDCFIHTFCEIV